MANTTPSLTRLTDKAKRLVTQVLKEDQKVHNEPVIFEVSVAVFPDPSATDLTQVGSPADPSALVPLPTLVVYLEIPGADDEHSLYIAPIIAPFQLDSKRIHSTVTKALASMREHRQWLLDNPDKSE